MAAYAKSNGIKTRGPVYNTFLFDELSTMQPERYLLQIAAFVSGARANSSTRARNRKDSKRTK
jgi:hypothetical protein